MVTSFEHAINIDTEKITTSMQYTIPLVTREESLTQFPPLLNIDIDTYNKRETGGVGAEGKPHAGEESVPHLRATPSTLELT